MFRKALSGLWVTCVFLLVPMTGAAVAATDIVMYGGDAATIRGNWSKVADTSAAGGTLIASADRKAAATSAPLAAPADYFEVPFTAAGATPYHVWVRLRAQKNSKWNDSLWAQFSDAVDATGAALYRSGTTSGLLINLENCQGCNVAGWGWQDKAFWLSQPATVQFAASGSHTIRIQAREDGVQVDQIVLSPLTYLATSPGQVEHDTTIVPKQVTATANPLPFTGVAAAVPGTIQAEDFDTGGEGVAYHDTTPGNSGSAYRTTDVDLETATDGAYDVGWTIAGEWLNYSVNVAAAGSYTIETRVAANGQGGTFHLEFNGVKSPTLTIPNTGGWQAWTTVSTTMSLGAGAQSMRVVFDANGPIASVGNLTWIRLSAAQAVTTAIAPTPYTGTPIAIPGTVLTENFDNGGEGVAYHDTTAGNTGSTYRTTDVDIQASSLGGYDIGWITDGEWLAYTVNVASAGSYTLQFSVASPNTTGQLHAAFGASATPAVLVPNTGGWQTWTTVSVTATLSAGPQVMKLVADGGGFNLAKVTVTAASAPPPPPPSTGGGGVINVAAGGDLQAALNNAQPGDTIVLQAGATFTGNFVLPAKSSTATTFITLRSSTSDTSLPPAGARIDPSFAPLLAKLQSPNSSPALATAPSAHHYQLLFLEFKPNPGGYGDILDLGDGSTAQNASWQVPHDLVVDRCYVHGDPANGQKRGIGLNSASTTIQNSYVADIKVVGQDSQAICGWNGPGPFTITNNYLEAAGENVLFGGADPAIPNLVPSDITFTHNYLSKPLAWRTQSWSVKNIFELKNAQRVTIDGNIFENIWIAAQPGYGIVFTPRNQGGTAPWSTVQQVTFTNNVVRHVSSAFNIQGTDDGYPSQMANAITVRNNLLHDVSATTYGGSGRLVQINGGSNITFDHNTVIQDGYSVVYATVNAAPGFVFTNNIAPDNSWAIMGDNASPGNGTIAMYFPSSRFQDGVLAGSNPATYPVGNYYPASMSAVGFVNLSGGNYRLSTTSPYRNAATDGTDVGCNVDAINAAALTKY